MVRAGRHPKSPAEEMSPGLASGVSDPQEKAQGTIVNATATLKGSAVL